MPGADSHQSDIPGYLPPQSTPFGITHYTPPHPDYGGADRFDYDADGNMTVRNKELSGQQRLVLTAAISAMDRPVHRSTQPHAALPLLPPAPSRLPCVGAVRQNRRRVGRRGGGRRWLSGRYFTHSLTLKYGFGPDDAPAVGEAACRRARTGLKTPEGFDAAKVLQAECRLFSTNDKVFGRLEILDVVVLDDLI